MSLETGTFISDLDVNNPVVGDQVLQGDDHFRLIKTVLKNTFPAGSKAFRFPTSSAEQTTTVNITFPDDQNKVIPVSASGATRTVNLPDPSSGASVNEDGFSVTIVKTDSSVNAVVIDGNGSQTINGATTLSLTTQWATAKLVWCKLLAGWIALITRPAGEFPSGFSMLAVQTTAPPGWTKSTAHNDKALRVVSGTASNGGTAAFSTVFGARTPAGTVGNTALTIAQLAAHKHFTLAAEGQSGGSISAPGATDQVKRQTSGVTGDEDYGLNATATAATVGVSSETGAGDTHTHSFTGTAMDFAVQHVDVIIITKD